MEKFIKDGQIVYLNQIRIYHEDGSYTCNITKETALANGWLPYSDPETLAALDFTKTTLSTSATTDNATALELVVYLPLWETFIGKALNQGQVVSYGNRPWRVRQAIQTVLENQAPGIETAALYERIDEEHEGTVLDPIPYEAPMEIFLGKIYIESGILYECTRNSETALTHTLAELVGTYVKIWELEEPTDPDDSKDDEPEDLSKEEGSLENPIEWLPTGDGTQFQSLILDKYYKQDNVVYKCIQALENTHYKLTDLVGTYVEVVEQ